MGQQMGIPLFRSSLLGGMLFSNASFCGPPRGPRPRRASPPAGPISSDPAPGCVAAAVFCPVIPFPRPPGPGRPRKTEMAMHTSGLAGGTSHHNLLTAGGWVSCSRPRGAPALPQLREMASLVTEERRASVAGNFSQTRPCLSPLTGHRDCVRSTDGQQEENAFLNRPTLDPTKAKGAAAPPHPPHALPCKPTACDGQWRQTGRDLHSALLDPTNPARSRLKQKPSC